MSDLKAVKVQEAYNNLHIDIMNMLYQDIKTATSFTVSRPLLYTDNDSKEIMYELTKGGIKVIITTKVERIV